jgi:hypothetical protein
MPIRATTKARRRSTSSLAVAATLVLAGCGPAAPTPSPAAAHGLGAQSDSSSDCLMQAWKGQSAPDKAFDRAHDRADGGSLSCATGTTASQFAATLAAVRSAAAKRDNAALMAEVGFPLLYIDRTGQKAQLDRDTLSTRAGEVFSPAVLTLLAGLRLEDLSVVPQEGAFADLGAVWLVAGRAGGRPRIVTIDAQALGEAAAAKRRH